MSDTDGIDDALRAATQVTAGIIARAAEIHAREQEAAAKTREHQIADRHHPPGPTHPTSRRRTADRPGAAGRGPRPRLVAGRHPPRHRPLLAARHHQQPQPRHERRHRRHPTGAGRALRHHPHQPARSRTRARDRTACGRASHRRAGNAPLPTSPTDMRTEATTPQNNAKHATAATKPQVTRRQPKPDASQTPPKAPPRSTPPPAPPDADARDDQTHKGPEANNAPTAAGDPIHQKCGCG